MVEDFHSNGLRMSSLLFVDDVVLFASSGGGLQLTLEIVVNLSCVYDSTHLWSHDLGSEVCSCIDPGHLSAGLGMPRCFPG